MDSTSSEDPDPYSSDFYQGHLEGAVRSAEKVVPIVIEWLRPRSVVDVGCGLGAWLSVFREHGVERTVGLDGAWVDLSRLKIPPTTFRVVDLAAPPVLDESFDLVVSLEVAEHLPPESADSFVAFLTQLGSVILFSAAVPGQGGTRHRNEQWPEYWTRLFAARGYRVFDTLRWQIWDEPEVDWWYAQNTLFFVREGLGVPALETATPRLSDAPLAVIHPRFVADLLARSAERSAPDRSPPIPGLVRPDASVSEVARLPVRILLRALPRALHRALRRILFAVRGA
jgi:SAM-dependent methyltransferase